MKQRALTRLSLLTTGLLTLAAITSPVQANEGYSLWSSINHSSVADNNLEPNTGRANYDGEINVISMGFDKRINNRLLAGLSLSNVDVNLDTPWNFGTWDSRGVSIAPYFTYLLDDTFSLSGSLGYTRSDVDITESTLLSGIVTSSHDSNRIYGSLRLGANRWFDKLNLSGHVGAVYSREKADGYTDSRGILFPSRTSNFSQAEVGVKAGYLVGKVMPYAAIAYGTDTNVAYSVNSPNRDKNGMIYTLGVNLFGTKSTSGGFYYRSADRSNIENDSFSANLTVRF